MDVKKGFTILEILVSLIIVGSIVAVALPYYTNSVMQSQLQAVENNLRAIAAGEEKYNEDHGSYYLTNTVSCPSTCNDFGSINSNLSLSMASQNDGFKYHCAGGGVCTASGAATNVAIDANGNLSCAGTCS